MVDKMTFISGPISTKRCCIHDNCPICKKEKAEQDKIEADRKSLMESVEKEKAKKKAEYGKRCKAWVSLIHKLSEVKAK